MWVLSHSAILALSYLHTRTLYKYTRDRAGCKYKKSENLRMAITGQHRIRLRSQKKTKRQMGLESVRDGSGEVNETDKIPLFLV